MYYVGGEEQEETFMSFKDRVEMIEKESKEKNLTFNCFFSIIYLRRKI